MKNELPGLGEMNLVQPKHPCFGLRYDTKIQSTADPASVNFSRIVRVFCPMNDPTTILKNGDEVLVYGKSEKKWGLNDFA
jgi:hypothetical protein